jgi:serine/threonine-protein kinase RsbW
MSAVKILAALSNGALISELTTGGHEVLEVKSPEDVETHSDAEPFCLVIDTSLEWAADAVVRAKAVIDGADRDRLPVVAIGARGKTPYVVPDALFPAPSADAVVEAAKSVVMRRARQRRLFDQEVILQVPTVPAFVEKAGDLLEVLVGSAGYAEEDAVKLCTTIREALGNAAEHGNKNDAERTVHINFLRTADRVTIVVTDEGPGFDTDAFLNRATEVSALEHTRSRREGEARPGGLGVFIMKETCDSISFNQKGNSIYLMKFLPGHAPD